MTKASSSDTYWIKTGLAWGAMMFVIMQLVFPLLNSDEITLKTILIGLAVWTLGGLSFGYTMKKINRKDDSKEV